MRKPRHLPFIRSLYITIMIIGLAVPRMALADANDVPEATSFTSQHWTTGLHLMAGLGVNTAYFTSSFLKKEAGMGLNINTSVGYYFFNDYAFEVSTNVMFNRVKRTLIWNTLGTMGLRFRLPPYLAPAKAHPYFKIAAGRGPSVFIVKGKKPEFFDLGGDRTQIEGDVLSSAYGFFQNSRDGTSWFLELSATVNSYRKLEAIRDNKEVPEVIDARIVTDHAAMYAVALTFGVVVF